MIDRHENVTTICIAGMHRSGTSMVARLLNLCGVYLGEQDQLFPPAPDNPAGYWENGQFVNLNDEILAQLGANWDLPPTAGPGWEMQPAMVPLRVRAAGLVQQLSSHELWAWKDPRNSITLPFWLQLVPNAKVIVCLRNPLEIARSLSQRNSFPVAKCFGLWLAYNKQILRSVAPEIRFITHYDAYFHDPSAELDRLLRLLDIHVPPDMVEKAVDSVSLSLHHHQATLQDLIDTNPPAGVVELYEDMCARTGPVYQLISESNSVEQAIPASNYGDYVINNRLEVLEAKVIEQEQSMQALAAQLAERVQQVDALQAHFTEKDGQLFSLNQQLNEIMSSKAWRFALWLRNLRLALLPVGSSREDLVRWVYMLLKPRRLS